MSTDDPLRFKSNNIIRNYQYEKTNKKNGALSSRKCTEIDQNSQTEKKIGEVVDRVILEGNFNNELMDNKINFSAEYQNQHSIVEPKLEKESSLLELGNKTEELSNLIDSTLNSIKNESDLKSKVEGLCRHLVKNDINEKKILIDKIGEKFATSEENQKLSYQIIVKAFSIDTPDNFSLYKPNSQALFAIEAAKFAAAKDGTAVSKQIEIYDIKSQTGLIEVAKISAEQNSLSTSQLINNYKIESEEGLCEVAKIAAANLASLRPFDIIAHYNIKSEKMVIEIATIAVKKSAKYITFIKDYNIKDPIGLINIAKSCASNNGLILSQNIHLLGIENEDALISIAKIAMGTHDMASDHIENYRIKNQTGLIDIAKISAARSAGTSKNIEKFHIQDKNALIEIANISMKNNAELTSLYFKNYGFESTQISFTLFLTAIALSQGKANKYIGNFNLPEEHSQLRQTFDLLNEKDLNFEAIRQSISTITESNQWPSLDDLLSKIATRKPDIQKISLIWMTHFLGQCMNEKITTEEFKFLMGQGFYNSEGTDFNEVTNTESNRSGSLEAVLNYSSPASRYVLNSRMVSLAKNVAGRGYASTNLQGKVPPHVSIPILFLSNLHALGVSKDVCDSQLKISKNLFFKEGKNLRVDVNVISSILESKELEVDDKQYLLSQINQGLNPFNKKKIIPFLSAILTINELNKTSELKKSHLENSTIPKILKGCVGELIALDEIDNFDEKFEAAFGGDRYPNFILTYAAKLLILKDNEKKQAFEALSQSVNGILQGKFPEMRYDLNKSDHLSAVFSERPELLKEWKKGKKVKFGDFLAETNSNVQPINFQTEFKNKIRDNENLPFLSDVLNQNKDTEIALKEIDGLLLFKNGDPLLNIQKNCIKLMDTKLTFAVRDKLLKEALTDLDKLKDSPELNLSQLDLKNLREELIKRNEIVNSRNKFTIEDTDDHRDLYLCGTETESCQSITTGGAGFNKCLTGYVLDGKNRLLAVKDQEGKIIARQIFRVLLDGKEPALFVEAVYPYTAEPMVQEALRNFAIQRAHELGLPLFSGEQTEDHIELDETTAPKDARPLASLGSPARFEYADNGGGVTNGSFTLNTSNRLA